ncbi:hypothetical protein PF005_g12388 [Phytophthora fragariae]|uniref:Uncharacterized protein n=1 Tax=Phytophthora fragariae TaxID=53985 RepID=A0A6A3ESC5_9STRA|nr:hypothetical protein PF003_g19083 [Phytophthora fragariae]KAE8936334.1 hypothetical protein PF009_g13739 [Phytophthora fragariae]KAE9006960.1 hypothetical protein PF011_g11341 [Phytophthora fragariae]KAE9107934.1 hypothetical protein PF007_g12850 [Phytophthora fragariae]KAE9109191.1 hypothetical protein PF010_g11638 [Phytophthora fragariae]
MLRDPLSSSALMSLSPASSPHSQSVGSPTDSFTSAASSPILLPAAAPTANELLNSNADSPTIAPLVSSTPLSVSPISMGLETAKSKPSATAAAAPAASNATHQKGQTGMNGGRWTDQEHQSFLAGLRLYGREWKKVAAKIKTRTSAQIRSHAQKYFAKLARDDDMRKHSGLSMVMPGPVGYFSDGGSSVAQNSGDDDADALDASRQIARAGLTGQFKGTAAILIAPMGSVVNGLYKQATGATKKRSRAAVTGFEAQLGMGPTCSSYPYKLQKRSNDAARVECLPSQEELLAKASPNLRHRLSSLIEAELCALQVLSCYAMLQQQDQISAPRQKVKRQGRPRKLATAPTVAAGSAKASSLGFSMLSTEQIPPTSSIY